MQLLRVLFSRLRALWTVGQRERELQDEIETHLSLLVDERMREGLSPAAARASARATFGGVEQIKETYRDQRGLPFLEVLGQDRDIAKMVFRQGFSLVGIGVAIGILFAVAASRLFVRLLFGMSPLDPLTFGGVVILFAVVAVAACYMPAMRATRITAMEALRYE